MTSTRLPARGGFGALLLVAALSWFAISGCGGNGAPGSPNGTTSAVHLSFPIAVGTTHALGIVTKGGAMGCDSCHAPTAPSFKEFSCVGCHDHEQTVTDRLHTSVAKYSYTSAGCLSCHPAGDKFPFDHKGVTDTCAMCHDVGTQFAALPKVGFTHPTTGGADCAGCHVTTNWKGAKGAPGADTHDPGMDLVLNALIPTYSGMSMSSLTPRIETLSMTMNHGSIEVPTAAFSACANCHRDANANVFSSGRLHPSLTTLMLAQPKACTSCHASAMPIGFVGALATKPARSPSSGEMKHDAVAWVNGVPTSTKLVTTECGVCHASPSMGPQATWATNLAGTTPAQFHPALDAAKLAQPASCVDCHANNLPSGTTNSSTPTSASTGASTGIPTGTLGQISHADVNVVGHDCGFCHTQVGVSNSTAIQGKEWAQARFHVNFTTSASPLVSNGTDGRCSTCHVNEKPGPAYTAMDHSAFTNAPGSKDCSSCHSFPGTGTTAAPNWLGAGGVPQVISVGGFAISQPPAAGTLQQMGISNLPHPAASAACSSCHATAAGGRRAIGYDHLSPLINSNCGSCHEAGSDLVGTAWNGATTAAGGAGDTRPYTIVGLVPSFKGNSRALTNDYSHFYPLECGGCHVVPAGDGPVTTGAAYKAAWKFIHNEGKMGRASCNMCHGSPNNLPGD